MKQNSWKYHTVSCCKKKKRESCGQIPDTHTLIHCTKSLFFLSKEGPLWANFQHQLSAFFFTGKKRIKKKSDSRGAASLGRSPKKRARQPTCTVQWNESLYGVKICLFVWPWVQALWLSLMPPWVLLANFEHQPSTFLMARKD